MKPMFILMAALTLAAGCTEHKREAPSPVDPQAAADAQALQTLRDLGLTPPVILKMVQQTLSHQAGGEMAEAPLAQTATSGTPQESQGREPAPTPVASAAAPPPVVASAPVAMPAPQEAAPVAVAPVAAPSPPAVVIVQAPPQPVVVVVSAPEVQDPRYFVEVLAPYGRWVEMNPYGRVWQPTVTIIDTGWRPYCQAGHWLWTDCGWYWESSYSWGWAAFHYGRWCYSPLYRWVWVPDTVWAPAWVSWRSTRECYGWAPLPPSARWERDSGFRGAGDDDDFDRRCGLSDWHYTFVPRNHLAERDLTPVALPSSRVPEVYHGSAPEHGSYTMQGNRIVNAGPADARAERSPQNYVRKLKFDPNPGPIAPSVAPAARPADAPTFTTKIKKPQGDARPAWTRAEPASADREWVPARPANTDRTPVQVIMPAPPPAKVVLPIKTDAPGGRIKDPRPAGDTRVPVERPTRETLPFTPRTQPDPVVDKRLSELAKRLNDASPDHRDRASNVAPLPRDETPRVKLPPPAVHRPIELPVTRDTEPAKAKGVNAARLAPTDPGRDGAAEGSRTNRATH